MNNKKRAILACLILAAIFSIHRTGLGASGKITIAVQPLGQVDADALGAVKNGILSAYRVRVEVRAPLPLPRSAYYEKAKRYRAEKLLDFLGSQEGGFDKIIGENESAGELNASLLPKGAKIAKALGTLGAASLAGAAFQKPESAVLFYATSDESINSEIEQLIRDNGFEPFRVGGLDQSIRIEVFGDLHEFGALGKTVTMSEVTL